MPVIRKSTRDHAELTPESYVAEVELQEALATFPSLLRFGDDPELSLVAREVALPNVGLLDVLLVDAIGLPIAVEVKLARNPESRRQVVGQIIDYVSALTSLTVDELDQTTKRRLVAALRNFTLDDDVAFDQLWEQVGTNLRAGKARYVIALDDVPPDLERIVRFLVLRSDLDIRLVRIAKYPDSATESTVFVPHNVVELVGAKRAAPSVRSTAQTSPELQAVLDAYIAAEPADPLASGQAANFRQIRPEGWPRSIHYEFVNRGDSLTIEIHLESDEVRVLAPLLQDLARTGLPNCPFELHWDARWSSGRGRVFSSFPVDSDPSEVGKAMTQLISATKGRIATALAGRLVSIRGKYHASDVVT